MQNHRFSVLQAEIAAVPEARPVGRLERASAGLVWARGLAEAAALGDLVRIETRRGPVQGEVVELTDRGAGILPEGSGEGLRISDPVMLLGPAEISPHDGWIGRILDAEGRPLDGRPLPRGPVARPLLAPPPAPVTRRRLGPRLATGLAAFDTVLPLVRGQRLGLFAGSGVGKSNLLAALAQGVEADLVVLALVGERGREVRDFVESTLGAAGMQRAVVVAATSDRPPLVRRRALWSAMSVAEHFRDEGRHVLFLADSITRFAEAHREIALAAGEAPSLRGFPPSVAHAIMEIAERAGPGSEASGGDITAVLSVLVAGSDMEEPIADIMRGVLDGHVVLDREIAERGRYPAIDLLRSVSRSLPDCAGEEENGLISLARRRLGSYDRAELMIQSGLYTAGTDPEIDAAITAWPKLDAFLGGRSDGGIAAAFAHLAGCLGRPPPRGAPTPRPEPEPAPSA